MIKLALHQRVFELSLQENRQQENIDNLLSMTHLSADDLDKIKIAHEQPLLMIKKIGRESILLAADFFELQKSMLDNHLDLAIQFNNYAQSEADLRLEIERQYPDLVLSPGFIFDQSDNIWALGLS